MLLLLFSGKVWLMLLAVEDGLLDKDGPKVNLGLELTNNLTNDGLGVVVVVVKVVDEVVEVERLMGGTYTGVTGNRGSFVVDVSDRVRFKYL